MKKKERKGSVTRYIQARISSALARKLLLLEWRQYGAEGRGLLLPTLNILEALKTVLLLYNN